MDKMIVRANYFIALLENAMTDDIHTAYFNSLEQNTESYLRCFCTILDAMLKNLKNNLMTKSQAIALVEAEYSKANMNVFLGNFSQYINFLNILFENKIGLTTIDLYKRYIEATQMISNNVIKDGILYGVLDSLLSTSLFATDLEFAKNLTSYLNEVHITDIHTLFAHLTTNSLRFN